MTTHIKVEGMTCQHCVASVTQALMELTAISGVTIDLPTGDVAVEHADTVARAAMIEAIEGQGYDILQ